MNYVDTLTRAIRDLHGCPARHLESVPVHEQFRGETVWEGVVEVFEIDHAQASRCYAWAFAKDDGGSQVVAVLGVPPITDAVAAVRASIVRAARG